MATSCSSSDGNYLRDRDEDEDKGKDNKRFWNFAKKLFGIKKKVPLEEMDLSAMPFDDFCKLAKKEFKRIEKDITRVEAIFAQMDAEEEAIRNAILARGPPKGPYKFSSKTPKQPPPSPSSNDEFE